MPSGNVYSKQYDLNKFILAYKMRIKGLSYKEIDSKLGENKVQAYRIINNNKNRKLYKKLKGTFDKDGYIKYKLRKKDGKPKYLRGHRIVGFCYLNLKEKEQINHKNGIKNDNRVENLECVNQSENTLHSIHVLGNSSIENLPDNRKPVRLFKNNSIKDYLSIKEMSRDNEDINYHSIVDYLNKYNGECSYKGYKVKLLIN